jgi:hypothetical protein
VFHKINPYIKWRYRASTPHPTQGIYNIFTYINRIFTGPCGTLFYKDIVDRTHYLKQGIEYNARKALFNKGLFSGGGDLLND